MSARASERIADVLTLGFGTSVLMWFVGYLGRLPGAPVPGWLLGTTLLACLGVGGALAGRWTARGWRGGAWAGLIAGALNLLILGSLLGGEGVNTLRPTALLWLPGSLLLAAALGALGASLAGRGAGDVRRDWTASFAGVAAVATLALLLVGGVVTSQGAGLAVVDWPNSFGYNMFLYPLARMTGGVYYEHAHRLFGSLVGITTVTLAVLIWRRETRRGVRGLAVLAVVLVVLQGVLGGLRVTGRFTLADTAEAMAPSVTLAAVHGVLGQLFFAVIVTLAVVLTPTWRERGARPAPAAGTERALSTALLAVLLLQLALGASQRHLARGLLIHISLAVVVFAFALAVGARAWGLYADEPILHRLGRWLMGLVSVQVVLGVAALAAVSVRDPGEQPGAWDVLLRTAHQATGALLLACAVLLALWQRRLLRPAEPERAGERAALR